MTFYLIAEANVRDKEGFNQKFAAVALQIFKECHGEFLARGYENAIVFVVPHPKAMSCWHGFRTWIC